MRKRQSDISEVNNPFTPKGGRVPPRFAGRERERRVLYRAIAYLGGRNPKPPPSDIIVSAPRGFGKTALLGHVAQQRERSDARMLRLSANRIRTMADLMRATLGDESVQARSETLEKNAGLSLGILGAGASGKRSRSKTTGTPPMSIDQWTRQWEAHCREHPTLLVVDEAHTLDLEVANHLFNAVQSIAGNGAPLALCVMGTPDMRAHLAGAGATFWNRVAPGSLLSPPPLSPDEAADAIRSPLAQNGLSIDDDALAGIVEHARGYPYFLQAWGSGVFDVAASTGDTRISVRHVEMAREEVEDVVDDHYAGQLAGLEAALDGDLRKLGALLGRRRCAARHARPGHADENTWSISPANPSMKRLARRRNTKPHPWSTWPIARRLVRVVRHRGAGGPESWLVPAIPSLLRYIVGEGDRAGPTAARALERARALGPGNHGEQTRGPISGSRRFPILPTGRTARPASKRPRTPGNASGRPRPEKQTRAKPGWCGPRPDVGCLLPTYILKFQTLMAEREGFEPSIRFRIHTFQACSFGHSDTSPVVLGGKPALPTPQLRPAPAHNTLPGQRPGRSVIAGGFG